MLWKIQQRWTENIFSQGSGKDPRDHLRQALQHLGGTAWVKGAYAVSTRSQFILAWRYGRGPSNYVMHLNGLRRDAARYGAYRGERRHWVLLPDTGFDRRAVREGDLIPPLRRAGKIVDPERKKMADLVSQARLDGLFSQRWKTETVNSVIKRKFGGHVRSRLPMLQYREPIIKGLIYNIHR